MSDSNSFEIRPARPSDRSEVLALVPRLRAFGPSPLHAPEELDARERRTIEEFFAAAPDGCDLFVAVGSDGEVLGAAYVEPHIDYFTQETHGHLGILAVVAKAEGRGIGRALIDAFENWASTAGYRFVSLSVFAANARAAAVYQRAGYEHDIARYVKLLELSPDVPAPRGPE